MAQEIVRYQPHRGGSTLTRYAPAITSIATSAAVSAAKQATKAVLSSLDWRSVGKSLKDVSAGYSSGGLPMVSSSGPSFMDGSGAAPVGLSNRFVSRRARIKRGRKGPTVITHRELINGSVAGSTSFTIQSTYPLNPGNATTFPWLSTQASQYEEYRFRKVTFEYVPIAPTSTQGDILLVPDYDSSNPAPLNETQAIDHVDATIDVVWKPLTMVLSPKDMHALGPRKYVRSTVNVVGDIKTFDCGNLYICTNNETGTGTIGKLFVSYEVELYTPFNGPTAPIVPTLTSQFHHTANQNITTATPTLVNFETLDWNPLGITLSTGNTFTPPAGVYRLEAVVTFVDSSTEAFSAISTWFKNGAAVFTSSGVASAIPSGANTYITQYITAIVVASGTDTFALSTTLTGAAGTLTAVAGKCICMITLA
jgi:hypothetical protein